MKNGIKGFILGVMITSTVMFYSNVLAQDKNQFITAVYNAMNIKIR